MYEEVRGDIDGSLILSHYVINETSFTLPHPHSNSNASDSFALFSIVSTQAQMTVGTSQLYVTESEFHLEPFKVLSESVVHTFLSPFLPADKPAKLM